MYTRDTSTEDSNEFLRTGYVHNDLDEIPQQIFIGGVGPILAELHFHE